MHWHGRARRFFEFSGWPGQRRAGERGRGSGGTLGLGLGLGLVTLGGGCGLSTKEAGGTAEALKKPELSCVRAGADRVEASSFRLGGQSGGQGSGQGSGSGNGKNDIVKVFVRSPEAGGGVTLSCKELDLNGDGRKDMLVYYDGHGRKLREEFDHDFDGLADMKSFYEVGQLVRQELDVDFDGKPDLVEHFENGKRVRLEKFLALPPATAPSKADAPASGEPAAAPSERSSGPAASVPTSGPAASERSSGPITGERSSGPAASERAGGPAATSPQAPVSSPDRASGLPPVDGR